ncbi:MAG: hypothetical protein FH751_16375 [Firmicutes bacterium]|nr:hypothetical protein [Bacillota bacterium]
MNKKIKTILSNAYFIGGSPCCGKSTITKKLADKYKLNYYKIDDYERKHVKNSEPKKHPIMYKFFQMNWNEVWMRPVNIQVKEEFEFYRERFEMVLSELNKFSEDKTVIMEGAALLPELIDKLAVDKKRILFMIPSKEFQIKHYSKRNFIKGILSECSNPEKAFFNWMERDYYFGRKVKSQAKDLGYKVINVNGKKTIEENMKIIERHFNLV